MKTAVITKKSDDAAELSSGLVRWLEKRGMTVTDIEQNPPEAGLGMVIVVGGDGTLLKAARMLDGMKVPIIGINMGGLGFLTEISPDEAFDVIDSFVAGKCEVSERMMLAVKLFRDGHLIREGNVLNDAVITKGTIARMIHLHAFVDNEHLIRYRADGLIVSTPTGSTAYSLSAGGPIISPKVQCMVLTPICPHTLTNRPFVVSHDSQVDIQVKSGSDVYLTLDGQDGSPLEPDDRIEIGASDRRTYIVSSPFRNYFEILRTKLHWGELGAP